MLGRKQFQLLIALEAASAKPTQRALGASLGISLGSVNKALAEAHRDGYLDADYRLTETGYEALEPYRVKRAVFIAAGFGSRLVPITLNAPKPLIRVKGKRMIEYSLQALVSAGIEEIYVVRGYLGGQFDDLLREYPTIRFLENTDYNVANNISSALCAADLLENAYVLEADLILRNPALISKYQYASNYLGVPVVETDDWCFRTQNGVITKMAVGGTDCYHMFGISYWNAEDGKKLARHIREAYRMPGGKERYWDQVALEYFIKEYRVEVRPCTFADIQEIDTLKELQQIDPVYRG